MLRYELSVISLIFPSSQRNQYYIINVIPFYTTETVFRTHTTIHGIPLTLPSRLARAACFIYLVPVCCVLAASLHIPLYVYPVITSRHLLIRT